MKSPDPLYLRMYRDPVLIDLTRKIGYVGFPLRSLADQVRELAQTHGVKKLSLALNEICTFQGNRVMLNPKARKVAVQLLGVPPERWPQHYEHVAHRPANWDNPPKIPEGGPDELMESFFSLTVGMLEDRLKKARWFAARSEKGDRTEVVAIESELIRRGQEIPPEEKPETPEAQPGKKKRAARKKAG